MVKTTKTDAETPHLPAVLLGVGLDSICKPHEDLKKPPDQLHFGGTEAFSPAIYI